MEHMNEYALWDAVVTFQKYPFHTVTGLPFTYELKKSRDGDYNRELVIDRRSGNKTIVWSSVMRAFEKAVITWRDRFPSQSPGGYQGCVLYLSDSVSVLVYRSARESR